MVLYDFYFLCISIIFCLPLFHHFGTLKLWYVVQQQDNGFVCSICITEAYLVSLFALLWLCPRRGFRFRNYSLTLLGFVRVHTCNYQNRCTSHYLCWMAWMKVDCVIALFFLSVWKKLLALEKRIYVFQWYFELHIIIHCIIIKRE